LNNKEMREEFIPCYCLMQRTIGLLLKKVNKNYYASTKLNDLLKILEQSGLSCFYVRLIISDSQNRNKMRN
jgi:transposase